eukprot:g11520.t1
MKGSSSCLPKECAAVPTAGTSALDWLRGYQGEETWHNTSKKRRRESSSSSESPEETSSLKVSAAKAKAKAKVAPGSSKLKVSAEHDELSGLDLLIAEGLPSEKRPRHGWDEAEEKESKPGLEAKRSKLVDEGNLRVDAATGQFLLKNASIVGQAFDGLHLPVSLRGGFIDELSVHLHLDVFNPGANVSLQILIKNVFLVFGAHTTDWSYGHVKQCKSKLVDLVMKILDLKPPRKAKAAEESATGWLSDVQDRLKQDLMKKVAEMIEVNITNFHVRFEDSKTQPVPYACGFKLGYCAVFATEDVNSQRTTGCWRHTVDTLADPLFSQTIVARRMSVYWDLEHGHRHFTSIPSGEEVFARFKRLNLRETFSACVVEKLLELYPPQHPRRKYMEGPTFRERLDYHQYIIFPAGLNAHITANKTSEATRIQKAPLRDADVVVYSLDVAIDSEQLRSINSLLSYMKNFGFKDTLMLSRPSQTINAVKPGSARRELVRAWWQHAMKAVQIICKIPKRDLSAEDLQNRAALRERYITAVNHAKDLDLLVRAGQEDARKHAQAMEAVSDMQMMLKMKEILDWRMQARDRWLARDGQAATASTPLEAAQREDSRTESKAARVKDRPLPQTLQVKVTFQGFQVFFLVAHGGFWYTKYKPGTLVDEERPEDIERPVSKKMHTRQPVVSASVKNIVLEVIQKGHKSFRVARWIEVSVGRLEVVNLNAGLQQPSRNIVSIQPIQKHKGLPTCIFLGLNTFELMDNSFVTGDTPLSAVLEPWDGLLGHTKDQFSPVTPVMLQNLGFLKEHVNDLGKLMTFAFARVGEVNAMDWAPFRRRMLFFSKSGLRDMDLVTDLARRPSQEALMKELLARLQRKVELAVGKSNMLGSFEVELDGVLARTVDHYNKGLVLCKQAQLGPLMVKLRRSGQPQALQVQIHHLHPNVLAAPSLPSLMNGGVSMLPWKTSMMLLPQEGFQNTAGSDRKLQEPRKGSKEKEAKSEKKGQRGSIGTRQRGVLSPQSPSPTETSVASAFHVQNLSWHYVLKDETTRSFVGFLPRTLSQDVCSSFFEKALEGAKWLQPSGPNGPIPRKTAWMVYFDCTCTYRLLAEKWLWLRYGRIEVEPQRYPPWMCTLMHWVMPCCGINEQKDWPNSCNLNLYQDGSASVGWHADDEHLFQGKNRDCRIISLSLGATRSFELRRNWSEADTIRLPLTAGDLCTMEARLILRTSRVSGRKEGMVQKHLQHRVPREDQVRAPRINLTWRWIVRHSPGCPARRSECPVFLSHRLRRILESILRVPIAEKDSSDWDSSSLEEHVAKAVAALTFHHNLPPSYVQYMLSDLYKNSSLDSFNLPTTLMFLAPDSAEKTYREVLTRLRDILRQDPSTNIDLEPNESLNDLEETATSLVKMKAALPSKTFSDSGTHNEEVVRLRRVERGMPRAWFGPDGMEEDNYTFKSAIINKLPIAEHKDPEEITQLINDNQIVLIQGETGCGKTTQVPQYILEAALKAQADARRPEGKTSSDLRRPVRIVVTQPRRIAAITVAKRVAEELGEKVGEGVVGYKIRGTTVAGPKCKLLFCTTGVILRRLANEGHNFMFGPKTVTHLLVDEVHERGVETDFMLTFLKQVRNNRPKLRVVLMSATMDTECFLKYFSFPEKVVTVGELVQPPMVVCPAFCHPVAECYLETINARLGRNRSPEAKSPDELRQTLMSESDGIDYELILKIVLRPPMARSGEEKLLGKEKVRARSQCL